MKPALLLVFLLALVLGAFNSHPNAQALTGSTYRAFTVASASGLTLQTSGAQESIVTGADGWTMTAGGYTASTHYARLKYNLPELAGVAPTTFYLRAAVVLPADFYTRQTVGFRIVNTGNSGTTLNGSPVGASGSTVIFTSVYFNSDHFLRVVSSYGNTATEFYKHPVLLPTGKHIFELYGDVANIAPWYLRIDGVQVASGVARLSPSVSPVTERVVTRAVAGIDGAAGLSSNTLSVQVSELAFADYDVNAVTLPPTATATLTATPVSTLTPTAQPTFTITPTASLVPTATVTLAVQPTATPECFQVSAGTICFYGK